MDKDTRNAIQRATQSARALLEREVGQQLEGVYDIRLDGTIPDEPGAHLDEAQRLTLEKLVAAVNHHAALGRTRAEAVGDYLREAAFTTLNRFVALKLLEARELVQECVSSGDQSRGFKEFCGLAPGLVQLADQGYRLYLESLFDEIGQEVGLLFDRRDPSSLIWPRRHALNELLETLNAQQLAGVWDDDETVGWVYQYFNSSEARKQMRDESQAPRNSRELAVRNQFFTPRYVVRFLVDNTLARTWWQMRRGDSRLSEVCEFLVLDNADELFREKKDPRDIKILDPACGSGHFLLYAFDLLETIYEEAWHDDASPPSTGTGSALRADYPELAELHRALPGLILGNNLFGVEIDPRAAQIAALALWLRAQRAHREQGIAALERPRITRTHVVVAEPMPGDRALTETFAASLQPPLLGDLFTRMVAEMQLAGELGTLLRVDEDIATTVTQAREDYVRQATTRHLPGLEPGTRQEELDFAEIDDVRFFEEAEAMLLDALHRFSASATGGGGVRRWMFADDAAQGIALVELLRTRFDVVLMNPPFGAVSLPAKKVFDAEYPKTKNDLFGAFVERGIELLKPGGALGAITSRTGFFLSRFQRFREEIVLENAPPVVFGDLGYGVLDGAAVEVAAYCLSKDQALNSVMTVFLRAIEASNKEGALRRHSPGGSVSWRFDVQPATFQMVPGSPFSYWVSDRVRRLFSDLPSLESDGRTARSGLATGDDFRWLRAWWEPAESAETPDLVPFAKGGIFSPFYADLPLSIRWGRDGRWIKEWKRDQLRRGEITPNNAKCWNESHYFRPGLTWPARTNGLSLRAMPSGCIFAGKGPCIFVSGDSSADLLALAALANSAPFNILVSLQLARTELAQSFEVGLLQATPVPHVPGPLRQILADLARQVWRVRHQKDSGTASSRAFVLPALLQIQGGSLAARADAWAGRVRVVEEELNTLQAEIDERCFELYGIDEADRRGINEDLASGADGSDVEPTGGVDEADNEGDAEAAADLAGLVAGLISWCVAVAVGRFDVRLATGERELPAEPGPFDPLPVCSPGMLVGEDGLPAAGAPAGYPVEFPASGVLVDDPGDSRDLTAAVRAIFDTVFGASADTLWDEAAALLDPRGHDIRAWLCSGLFEHHLKLHSKSRRKAPILWQLGTPSGRYSVWLYAHRLTDDSFFQLQNDVLAQKLAFEERQLVSLVQGSGGTPSAKERREIEAQEAFVEELRVLFEEVKRVATLWKPTLDDGVVLVMAPLWRLVPHKPWQRELKKKWEELAAGKYDWAQVAMHLWPERVVPKCAEDRSLAIAHGLEHIFWMEDEDGKWQPREEPPARVEELTQERTSTAAKDALRGAG